jgi:glycosyltransferase involved in cell wall biosynthesis
VVVGGYNHPTMLVAIAWARSHGIPYYLMSEAYLGQRRSWWRRLLKAPLVRSIVRHAAGCFPTGTLATEYLAHYGASRDKLWCIPNTPDVESLWKRARMQRALRQTRHARHGFDGSPVVVFAGRLVGFKQVDLLLRAFQKVRCDPPATLMVLGDGPLRARLEAMAEQLQLGGRVRFLGFINPQDLPEWYSMADLFVLPSSDETWGVVVLEALASGVPVVVSDHVGCHADVVRDPAVGDVVPALDEDALARAIARRLAKPSDPEEVARRWAPIRDQYRYPVLARRLVGAIQQTCKAAS